MTYAAGSDVDPEGQKVRTGLCNCIPSVLGTVGARIP